MATVQEFGINATIVTVVSDKLSLKPKFSITSLLCKLAFRPNFGLIV